MNINNSAEHKRRIDVVLDYIIKNLHQESSLETLAAVANYSPFHFQKVFTSIMGESPKQYVKRLRIENAAHSLIIHPHKSVLEISIECGYSSPSVFSRAVNSHFGCSPEMFRHHSHAERARLYRMKHGIEVHEEIMLAHLQPPEIDALEVSVKRTAEVKGIYVMAPFDDHQKITEAFGDIVRMATTHDLSFRPEDVFGIITPHQGNIYKAFIALGDQPVPSRFMQITIPAGKFATFKLQGGRDATIQAAQAFYKHWLPESGYRLAGVSGFELFVGNPAATPYEELIRELYAPIEAI